MRLLLGRRENAGGCVQHKHTAAAGSGSGHECRAYTQMKKSVPPWEDDVMMSVQGHKHSRFYAINGGDGGTMEYGTDVAHSHTQ